MYNYGDTHSTHWNVNITYIQTRALDVPTASSVRRQFQPTNRRDTIGYRSTTLIQNGTKSFIKLSLMDSETRDSRFHGLRLSCDGVEATRGVEIAFL